MLKLDKPIYFWAFERSSLGITGAQLSQLGKGTSYKSDSQALARRSCLHSRHQLQQLQQCSKRSNLCKEEHKGGGTCCHMHRNRKCTRSLHSRFRHGRTSRLQACKSHLLRLGRNQTQFECTSSFQHRQETGSRYNLSSNLHFLPCRESPIGHSCSCPTTFDRVKQGPSKRK